MLNINSDSHRVVDYTIHTYRVLMFLIMLILSLVLMKSGMLFFLSEAELNHLLSEQEKSIRNNSTVTTFFIVVFLLISAVLLAVIILAKRRHTGLFVTQWIGLAVLFFAFAFCEATDMYTKFDESIQKMLDLGSGLFFERWIIPFGMASTVFLIIYIRFLIHLPNRSLLLFIIACLVYVASVFIAETVRIDYNRILLDYLSMQQVLTIADGAKMFGASLFIFSLLDYMNKYMPKINLQIK